MLRVQGRSGLVAIVAAALFFIAGPGSAAAQTFSFTFGSTTGSAPGALAANASGIAIDADGNPWVADPDHDRIVKYTFNGSFVGEFSAPAGGGPAFADPEAIAADASGSLYVVQGGSDNRIIKIDTGGTFIRTIGPNGPGGRDLIDPVAIAVDSTTGKLYVAEATRIVIYSADGVPLGSIPISSPTGVAVSGGDVYAAFSGFSGQEVVRFVGETSAIANPIGAGLFTGTVGEIAADSQGRIYVADGGGSIIRRFNRDGAQIDTIGTSGLGANGELNIPTAVALDCRDNVYVVDQGQRTADNQPASKAVKYTTSNTPPPCGPRPPAPGALDLQINDVEVTQAIQPERTYTAGPPPAMTLGDLPETQPRSRAYGPPEVSLQANGKTVVRMYATLRNGTVGGVANVPATLSAVTADGRVLGPIQPDAKPAVIQVGNRTVTTAQRTNPAGAYTFTLPQAWTAAGTVELVARLNPAGIGCEGPCVNRTTFRLTGVTFQKTVRPKVVPIALTDGGVYPVGNDGQPIYDPHPIFDVAQMLAPVDLDIYGYHAQAEVGDLINLPSITLESCFLGIEFEPICTEDTYMPSQPEFRDYLQGELMDRVEDAADDADIDDCDMIPIGLVSAGNGTLPGVMRGDWENKGFFECAIGYAAVSRPFTAVAHEIQHAFARPHASQGCGATGDQEGEAWPPDNRGLLGGIGLDVRTGSGGAMGPYKIMYGGVDGLPAEIFDLMGYCAGDSPLNAWISPRGWGAVLGFRQSDAKARPPAARATAARELHVTAIESSGGKLGITGVSPLDGEPASPDPSSGYTIEARNEAGALLASAPAGATQLDDGGGVLIDGTVAAPAGTTQVFVWRGTEAGTRRVASASGPKVRLVSPKGGSRVGAKNMTVRWRASDADGPAGGPLEATVEYAPDGKRFSAIYTGPAETGAAQIRRSLLAGSDRAKVRVSVDDGFRVDRVTSKSFSVAPTPPDVRISDPGVPVTIAADSTLTLTGQAFAPGGKPLRTKALRWSDRRDDLGRGASVSVSGLKPGRHKITLTARAGGITGRDSTIVTVAAVKPEFLELAAPAISAKAKKMKLRVASTVAAKLKVGRKTFKVSPKATSIKVAVPKGKTTFALGVTLKAGGLKTPASVVVERG